MILPACTYITLCEYPCPFVGLDESTALLHLRRRDGNNYSKAFVTFVPTFLDWWTFSSCLVCGMVGKLVHLTAIHHSETNAGLIDGGRVLEYDKGFVVCDLLRGNAAAYRTGGYNMCLPYPRVRRLARRGWAWMAFRGGHDSLPSLEYTAPSVGGAFT